LISAKGQSIDLFNYASGCANNSLTVIVQSTSECSMVSGNYVENDNGVGTQGAIVLNVQDLCTAASALASLLFFF
jgi:hypothetical protein